MTEDSASPERPCLPESCRLVVGPSLEDGGLTRVQLEGICDDLADRLPYDAQLELKDGPEPVMVVRIGREVLAEVPIRAGDLEPVFAVLDKARAEGKGFWPAPREPLRERVSTLVNRAAVAMENRLICAMLIKEALVAAGIPTETDIPEGIAALAAERDKYREMLKQTAEFLKAQAVIFTGLQRAQENALVPFRATT